MIVAAARQQLYWGAALLLVLSMVAGLIGYECCSLPAAPPAGPVRLVVKIKECRLEVWDGSRLHKHYSIAAGHSDTPTPVGDWRVAWKSPRDGGPFGKRFIALDIPWGGYGIHGTNAPWSIGLLVSQGCIRLGNKDVEELYEWVTDGTPVRIEGPPAVIERRLQRGNSGADVVRLQQRLQSLGYLEGRADGCFNADTEAALRRFQHGQGLTVTGEADTETIKGLGLK